MLKYNSAEYVDISFNLNRELRERFIDIIVSDIFYWKENNGTVNTLERSSVHQK